MAGIREKENHFTGKPEERTGEKKGRCEKRGICKGEGGGDLILSCIL